MIEFWRGAYDDGIRSFGICTAARDDGLEALRPLDVAAAGSVDALVRGMAATAFGGRNLGEAADVLEAMVRDPTASAC